jgi:hypothetical protein
MRLDDIIFNIRQAVEDCESGRLPRDCKAFAETTLAFFSELVARMEDGRFEDPLFVRALTIDANPRYLRALYDPSQRPGPWKVAIRVAERGSGKKMRNLLLGINAHILNDVVITLSKKLDPNKREQQLADYLAFNDIIRETMDVVQDHIEYDARFLEASDALSGRADEVMTWLLFKYMRGLAFEHGEQLRDGKIDQATIERNATAAATALAWFPF